jgi:hypothetical protein
MARASEDRYWSYQGEKVLLLGGWNHGHNPFLDHDTQDANGRSGSSSENQITAAMDELAAAGGNLLRCVLDPGAGASLQGFDFCARAGGWMGSAENAVEEFWRSLLAGVAGVRFHRPDSGIGLSERSKNAIRAARLIESKVKFWEVECRQDLLSQREPNEAYLSVGPGPKLILFLTEGGSVRVDLTGSAKRELEATWVNITTGEAKEARPVTGGRVITLESPKPGPWAVAICFSNR